MSYKATLSVPEEAIGEFKVKIEIEVSLKEAANLEAKLLELNKAEGEKAEYYGRSWSVYSLAHTIKYLRERAESTLHGFNFAAAPADKEEG